MRTEWGTGTTVDLTITNTGGSNINGWILAWTFPGNQRIDGLWNGSYTQNGQNVSVSNAPYNAVISAAGGSVVLGFNASYSGANTSPSSFAVNGVTCASSVILPTATPTATATATNTPVPPTATATSTPAPSNVLQRSNLSGSRWGRTYFTVNVPAGATNLQIKTSGGSGDVDLYVRFGSQPTLSSYNCRPRLSGNNETCTFSVPQAGTYYLMLYGYAAYSGVSLVGSYQGGAAVVSDGAPASGPPVQIYLPIIMN